MAKISPDELPRSLRSCRAAGAGVFALVVGDSGFRTFFGAMVILTGLFNAFVIAHVMAIVAGELWGGPGLFLVLASGLLIVVPLSGVILYLPAAMAFMTITRILSVWVGHRRAIQIASAAVTMGLGGAIFLIGLGFTESFSQNYVAHLGLFSILGALWAPRVALWAYYPKHPLVPWRQRKKQ